VRLRGRERASARPLSRASGGEWRRRIFSAAFRGVSPPLFKLQAHLQIPPPRHIVGFATNAHHDDSNDDPPLSSLPLSLSHDVSKKKKRSPRHVSVSLPAAPLSAFS
jgi:hypothetical protein